MGATLSLPRSFAPDEPTTPSNLLLSAVPAEEYAEFRCLLECTPLHPREMLQKAGDAPDYVYFPVSGSIPVLTVLETGAMIEFATVGHEGTTGVPVFLGIGDSNMAFISQVPGKALRMKRSDFLAAVDHSPGLAAIIKHYAGTMLAFVAQSAACNRAHRVDERSEFLAQMLGVSRPSVALSAGALRKEGLIRYHRGEMTIVDRRGLERRACECYAVDREYLRRLQD